MAEGKKYFLSVNGKNVEVTEEVYRVIKRDEDREAQRRYRSWRCRDGKGVRCKNKCEECPYYRMGNGPTGSVLSIDHLMDDEDKPFDVRDTNTDVELEVARRLLAEDVLKAKATLTDRDRIIMEMVMEGESERKIAQRLGVSNSRAHALKTSLLKKLEVLLDGYRGYFG